MRRVGEGGVEEQRGRVRVGDQDVLKSEAGG